MDSDLIKIILFLIIAFGASILSIIKKLAEKAKESNLTPLNELGMYGEEEGITPLQPYEPKTITYDMLQERIDPLPAIVKQAKPKTRKRLSPVSTDSHEMSVESGVDFIEGASDSIKEDIAELMAGVRSIESISAYEEPGADHIREAVASVHYAADNVSSVAAPKVIKEQHVPLMDRLAGFNDMQKAIILSEILNKPPALRNSPTGQVSPFGFH